MGLSCPLIPAKAKLFGVIFWPYSRSFIDEACSVKMAGYWPRSVLFFIYFFAFLRGARIRLGS